MIDKKPNDRYNADMKSKEISHAAKLLGSIKSDKKARSSRINAKKGGRPRKRDMEERKHSMQKKDIPSVKPRKN